MLSEKNWQRDLLKILLYAAGVIITAMAVPTFFTVVMVTLTQAQSASHGSADPIWLLTLQPTVEIIAGLLLARWSGWLAVTVFPDQPVRDDPEKPEP